MMLHNCMTVDPGVRTGFAIWQNGEPAATGIINGGDEKGCNRFQRQWLEFQNVIIAMQIKRVYIEDFEIRGMGSEKACKSLPLLGLLTGGYCCIAFKENCFWEMVSPRWLGSLDDNAIIERLDMIHGKVYRHHECDAVAMGYWLQGKEF